GPPGVWLRPQPGGEIATLVALQNAISENGDSTAPGIDAEILQRAAGILKATGDGKLAVIFAPSPPLPAPPPKPAAPAPPHEAAKAAANIAISCKGAGAAASLHVLPATGNANGIAD